MFRRILMCVVVPMLLVGCSVAGKRSDKPVPLPPNVTPEQVVDVQPEGPAGPSEYRALEKVAQARTAKYNGGPLPGAGYNVIAFAGGGSHGAYEAGLVCGWADAGTMPTFDVVTGVSIGSLVACLVFPGEDHLPELKRLFTTLHQRPTTLRGDLWDVKLVPPLGVGTDSPTRSGPYRKLLECITGSSGYWEKVVAAHACGRRFYVGTTNVNTLRFTTWDMGAIASKGTPEAHALYLEVLMASAAVPATFQPREIGVDIDGAKYAEFHVDGGIVRNQFIRMPAAWPGPAADPDGELLAGANVYVAMAEKLRDDPEAVRLKLLPLAGRGIEALYHSGQRAELAHIFSYCRLFGMNCKVAAIPQGFDPAPAVDYDPPKLSKLFCEGYTRAQSGTAWQDTPADDYGDGHARRGPCLTARER